MPVKDGQPSRRSRLETQLKVTGRRPDGLDEPQLPLVASRVWESFWVICGPEPLTWNELEAFQRCSGISFEKWEARAVMLMERGVRQLLMDRIQHPEEGDTDG